MKNLLFMLMGFVWAQTALANTDLETIKNLFESGRSLEAYKFGLDLQFEYEGDPRFDYYFGASAIDAENASLGVFALERVLIQRPGHQAARLELARGYFILGEYGRARYEFNKVLEADPPDNVVARIQQYMDAMRLRESRYQSNSQARFRLGMGYDSNVNAGPDSDIIEITGFTGIVTIPNDAQEQDSHFSEVQADVLFDLPISRTLSFATGAQVAKVSNPKASTFDNTSSYVHLGLNQRLAKHNFFYQAFHQRYLLDADHYRNLTGMNVNWRYSFSRVSQWQTSLQFSRSHFPGDGQRDTTLQVFNTGYLKQFRVKYSPLILASVYWGRERPKEDDLTSDALLGRDFYGLSVINQISLGAKQAVQLGISVQKSEAPEPYLPELFSDSDPKEDDFVSVTLGYSYLLSKHWKLDFKVNHSDSESNVGTSDYSRTRYLVNLTYGN